MSQLLVFLWCVGLWTLFYLLDSDGNPAVPIGLITGAGCGLALHWLQEKLK